VFARDEEPTIHTTVPVPEWITWEVCGETFRGYSAAPVPRCDPVDIRVRIEYREPDPYGGWDYWARPNHVRVVGLSGRHIDTPLVLWRQIDWGVHEKGSAHGWWAVRRTGRGELFYGDGGEWGYDCGGPLGQPTCVSFRPIEVTSWGPAPDFEEHLYYYSSWGLSDMLACRERYYRITLYNEECRKNNKPRGCTRERPICPGIGAPCGEVGVDKDLFYFMRMNWKWSWPQGRIDVPVWAKNSFEWDEVVNDGLKELWCVPEAPTCSWPPTLDWIPWPEEVLVEREWTEEALEPLEEVGLDPVPYTVKLISVPPSSPYAW
jgi:hypothetical protein